MAQGIPGGWAPYPSVCFSPRTGPGSFDPLALCKAPGKAPRPAQVP